MIRLALCSALSDRVAGDRLKVVDDWGIPEPSTKAALTWLDTLGLRPADTKPPRLLIVLDRSEDAVWKSFRNLGERVRIVLPDELNAYDVLLSDWVIFSKATLETTNARLGTTAGVSPDAASDAVEASEVV
jgi:large subunit ribosomal protein L4